MKTRYVGLIASAALLVIAASAAAQSITAAADPRTLGNKVPIAQVLNPDGTLNTRRGVSASIDPNGHKMVTGKTDALRLLPRSLASSNPDDNWDGRFSLPGVNGKVFALAVSGSTVYAGGTFETAGLAAVGRGGAVQLNYIARWDGTRCMALGSGMNDFVLAVAVGPDGEVYAGGWFTTAGGVSANYIARWDGTSWSALGSGLDGLVSALAVSPNGELYAGGDFTTAGGVSANRIARWDGTSWSALGSGRGMEGRNGGNGWVNALAVSPSGEVYAGGHFTTAGGVSANNIARWDGTSWSALGGGIDIGDIDASHWVTALAVGPGGEVYAGGWFTTAGGVSANNIARWDGTTWTALGGGMDGTVAALTVRGSDVYAGVAYGAAWPANFIARWDGASWSTLGSGIDFEVYALAVSASGALYAGGGFGMAGDVSANSIARWDGAGWAALGGSPGVRIYALAVSAGGEIYAGGLYKTARWDGTSWTPLGSGMDGLVYALALSPNGELYAGGEFTTAGGVNANHVARWDGTSWAALGSGTNGDVHALVVSGSSVYVAGVFTTAGGLSVNHIARWDGTGWAPLASGMDGVVYALALSPNGELYAGGDFTTAGGASANRIARWDGTSWAALGSGSIEYSVHALAVSSNGDVYAGGWFATVGDVSVNHIARWDGTSWSALGVGMSDSVWALAVGASGEVYAGGDFTMAGGLSANHVARWDGATWGPLGSGIDVDSYVFALALSGSDVCVGGIFPFAGGKWCPHFAIWRSAGGCAASAATDTPTPTETPIPVDTPTPTPSPTVTEPPTPTPSATPVFPPTATDTPTPPAPTATATPTATPVPPATVRVGGGMMAPGGSITVPVEVLGATNLGAAAIEVHYDRTVLQATGCRFDPEENFDFGYCNVAFAPGVVRLNAISLPGFSGDGFFANVTFRAVGAPGAASPLTLAITTFADTGGNPLPVITQNGLVDIGLRGDVNCDSAVNVIDGLFVLQSDVGLRAASDQCPPPAGTLFLPLCDVNGDSSCDSVDALFILQCDVGMANGLCPGGDTRPSDHLRAQATLGGAGVPACVSIDTPGARGSSHRAVIERPQTATVSVGSGDVTPGGAITVPVAVADAANLGAATIGVHYDPAVVQASGCRFDPGNHFDAGYCNATFAPDTVRLNTIALTGFSGNAVLANITFQATGTLGATTTLGEITVTFTDPAGNLTVAATGSSGQIAIAVATPTSTRTRRPTRTPTATPTYTRTHRPTRTPTATPTYTRTHRPTRTPTAIPTSTRTRPPTHAPTRTVRE